MGAGIPRIYLNSDEFLRKLRSGDRMSREHFTVFTEDFENEDDLIQEASRINLYRHWLTAILRDIYRHIQGQYPDHQSRTGLRQYRRFMDKYNVSIVKDEELDHCWTARYGKDPDNLMDYSSLLIE